MADGKVVIDIILEDGSVAKGVANVDKSLGGIGDTAEKSSISIGKVATALGLVFLAKKGIDMVRDSIQGAFNRIDTMEQFQRVMNVMVDDTDAVAGSLSRLEDITEGTSMRMDVMANGVQNFVTRGMEIDKATDTMEAWGNAVAFYGDGSNEQFQNVTDALQNMVAKGKVGQDQLNRLFEAGIPATEIYADAVGKSTSEVEEALSKGEISAEDFVDTVSKAMMEGTDKFPEISTAMKDMGMSWGSVLSNMGAYVELGVTDIILAIDKMLEENGLPDMRQMLDNFAQAFGAALSSLAEKIPDIVDKIKQIYDALEPWMPLIKSIVIAVGTFITAFAGIQTVIGIINKIRTAILLMNAALMANPVGLVVAAVIAAVALIYVYWEPISEFFIGLWESVKEATETIWENITEGLANAKENILEAWESLKEFFSNFWESILEIWTETIETIQELWNGLLEFFSELWEGIKELFTSSGEAIGEIVQSAFDKISEIISVVYDFLNEITGGTFGEIVELIQSALTTAQEIVKSIWEYIKQTFNNVLDFLKALVKGDFEGMKQAMQNQMDSAKQLLSNIWNAIKSNIGAKLSEILSDLISKFSDMVSSARDKAGEILTAIKDKFTEIVSAVRDKLTEAVTTVGEKIGEMPGKVIEFTSDMMSAGKGLIQGLISGIKNMGKQAIEAITGVVGGVIDKAKSLLSINSPSKLFEQFGAWTSEGLAIGISDMQGMAEKASEKLGLGVEGAFNPSLELDGISALDELKGLSANSVLNVHPNNSGIGKSTSTTENKYNNVNFDGLFNGANFHVNNENDIPKIAKELNDYIKKSARGKGVVVF